MGMRYPVRIPYYKQFILWQLRLSRGYVDSLCVDDAEVSMAGMRSNQSCPTCWCTYPHSDGVQDRVWLEYAYCKLHPVLQYLSTKLAEWIGENVPDKLGFPDKQDPTKCSVSKPNDILHRHVVCCV